MTFSPQLSETFGCEVPYIYKWDRHHHTFIYSVPFLSIHIDPFGGSQCPNLGTPLQGAGAERTSLISAIRGDPCASFQHITAHTCCHGPAPCWAAVKEAQNRDPGKNWELNFSIKQNLQFFFPFVFSGHSLLQKLRKKNVQCLEIRDSPNPQLWSEV